MRALATDIQKCVSGLHRFEVVPAGIELDFFAEMIRWSEADSVVLLGLWPVD